MAAKFGDGSVFRMVLETMSEVAEFVQLEFCKGGLVMTSRQASVYMPKGYFIKYTFVDKVVMNFNISSLLKIAKHAAKDSKLTLSVPEENKVLLIKFSNDGFKRNYTVIEVEDQVPKKPNDYFAYVCTVKLPSKEFARLMLDLSTISDKITFRASTTNIRSMEFVAIDGRNQGVISIPNVPGKVTVNVRYSFDYEYPARLLAACSKGSNLSREVELKFQKDEDNNGWNIMVMEFQLESGNFNGFLRLYLPNLIGDPIEEKYIKPKKRSHKEVSSEEED